MIVDKIVKVPLKKGIFLKANTGSMVLGIEEDKYATAFPHKLGTVVAQSTHSQGRVLS